jgi:hypothetical protein
VNLTKKVLYRRTARRTGPATWAACPGSPTPPGPGRGWIDLVAGISRAQQDGDLHSGLDATALATIVAATDGLKDLSGILDPPHRARRGFEQPMQHLIDIVEATISRDEHPSRLTTRSATSSQ